MGRLITVSEPRVTERPRVTRVSAEVRGEDARPTTTWFRVPAPVTAEQASDALFATMLVPAMLSGATLRMHSPVSARLLEQAPAFHAQHRAWYPGEVAPAFGLEVEARTTLPTLPGPADPPAAVGEVGGPRGTVSCFTGGVDSFYSALVQPQPISHLIYMHGFDVPLQATAFRQTVARRLKVAARELGIPLVQVSSNLRTVTNRTGGWIHHQHGSAIAAVGILLASRFHTLVLPSSAASISPDIGNGSHILTDHLHNTEYSSVLHHAPELSRIAKLEPVARSDAGARHLRVCWRTRTAWNCGQCAKCRRTLVDLHGLNLRRRVKTFPGAPTRHELLSTLVMEDENPAYMMRTTLQHLRAVGGPVGVIRAMERAFELAGEDPDGPPEPGGVSGGRNLRGDDDR